jgi:hypothetical protein
MTADSSSSSSVVDGNELFPGPLLPEPDESSSSSKVPVEGVVLRGRAVAGSGALSFGGVVDRGSDSAMVSSVERVVFTVATVVEVVVVVEVVLADWVLATTGSPGFCHTDRVVAPTVGNSASLSASAEPAEPSATTANKSVPVARRSFRENSGTAAIVSAERVGRARTTRLSGAAGEWPCRAQSRLA